MKLKEKNSTMSSDSLLRKAIISTRDDLCNLNPVEIPNYGINRRGMVPRPVADSNNDFNNRQLPVVRKNDIYSHRDSIYDVSTNQNLNKWATDHCSNGCTSIAKLSKKKKLIVLTLWF